MSAWTCVSSADDSLVSALASRGSGYSAVRTRFELNRVRNTAGVDCAVVKLSVAGRIEEAEQLSAVIEIRKQYANMVRSMDVTVAEYDTIGWLWAERVSVDLH